MTREKYSTYECKYLLEHQTGEKTSTLVSTLGEVIELLKDPENNSIRLLDGISIKLVPLIEVGDNGEIK